MSHEAIVDSFRARVRELKQKHHNTQFDIIPRDKDLTGKGNRFVAVIDSITSLPGVRLPWKTLVQICREEGIWSVIDAAHSIGQEVCRFISMIIHRLPSINGDCDLAQP